MNTTLFSQFSPAIRDINTKADSPTLLLGAQGPLSIYYAPFDALNPQARVVLVGITPGRTQANNALAEARRQLQDGASAEQALRAAKKTGAFSGAMRSNLVALMDHIGLQRWLGIGSCEALFGASGELLHTTSILPYPVFLNGDNYNGKPDPIDNTFLRSVVQEHFVPQVRALPTAVFVPLGPVATGVMQRLQDQGVVPARQVLTGLPHPSGANAERIQYFLGRKAAAALSTKTDPSKLDAARQALSIQVLQLS